MPTRHSLDFLHDFSRIERSVAVFCSPPPSKGKAIVRLVTLSQGWALSVGFVARCGSDPEQQQRQQSQQQQEQRARPAGRNGVISAWTPETLTTTFCITFLLNLWHQTLFGAVKHAYWLCIGNTPVVVPSEHSTDPKICNQMTKSFVVWTAWCPNDSKSSSMNKAKKVFHLNRSIYLQLSALCR